MASVIIPTLQHAPHLAELVKVYNEHPRVGEILIVNNSSSAIPNVPEKVRVLEQDGNIFVNPAWNLGAQQAAFDYLIISNDDILVGADYIDYALSLLDRRLYDMVGPHRSSLDVTGNFARKHRPAYFMNIGYGALMIMRRESYVQIPDTPKIWTGDDWLFWNQRRHPGVVIGFPVITDMGTTSSSPEYRPQYVIDQEWWRTSGVIGQRWWHHTVGLLGRYYESSSHLKERIRGLVSHVTR